MTNALITKICEIYPANASKIKEYGSVFDITRQPKSVFIKKHTVDLNGKASEIYDLALGYATEVARQFRKTRLSNENGQSVDMQLGLRANMQGPTYQRLFKENWADFCRTGALEANDSPAAYLADIYKLALEMESAAENSATTLLGQRRPDLARLKLNDVSLNQVVPMLSLVNQALSESVQASFKNGEKLHEVLAGKRYPFGLPYDYAQQQIKLGLAHKKSSLMDIIQQADAAYPYFTQASLRTEKTAIAMQQGSGLGRTLQTLIIESPKNVEKQDFLKENYSVANVDELKKLSTLTAQTGLTTAEVEQLLCVQGEGENSTSVVASPNVTLDGKSPALPYGYGAVYIHANTTPQLFLKQEGNSITLKNPSLQHFDRINRLIRLQRELQLPYDKLDLLVVSAMRADRGNKEATLQMNTNTVRMLGVWRYLHAQYGVTPEMLAAFVHEITPFAVGTEAPFFDRIFNSPPLFDQPFKIDGKPFDYTKKEGDDAKTVKQLCTGLGIDEATFQQLAPLVLKAQPVQPQPQQLTRSLPIVSAFYRLVKLPQLFGLTVPEGMTLLEQLGGDNAIKRLAGVPVISPLDKAGNPTTSDVLDLIMALASATQWLQTHHLSVGNLTALLSSPPKPLSGNAAQVALVKEVAQHLEPTRLTSDRIAAAGLPTHDDEGKPINWLTVLSDFLDGDGLFELAKDTKLPTFRDALVSAFEKGLKPKLQALIEKGEISNAEVEKAVLDSLSLNEGEGKELASILTTLITQKKLPSAKSWEKESKPNQALLLNRIVAQAIQEALKLIALITQAKTAQENVTISMLSKSLQLSQQLPLLLLRWVGKSSHGFLSQIYTLSNNSQPLQPSGLDQDYLELLYKLVQHTAVINHFKLSAAMVQAFLAQPDWFGCADAQLKLSTLYRFSRYADWLALTSKTEDHVLQYLTRANDTKFAFKDATEAASMLADLLGWKDSAEVIQAAAHITTKDTKTGMAKTLTDIDGVMRLQALARQTGLSVDTLVKAAALTPTSTYADYQQVGESLMAAIQQDPSGKGSSIAAQLNESQRDALVAYYLGQVIPTQKNDPIKSAANPALVNVKTADDLYEYLLIDNQVSEKVMTSQVAQAISSVQQYINSILLGMESGYDTPPHPTEVTAWTQSDSQYPLWAANQQLQDYPENYLDPTLRLKKTSCFNALENTLNQNKLNDDTIQAAVLGYLNQFEEVSNLEVVSGYIDGLGPGSRMHYFVGRKHASPTQYYWRSLDMSKRDAQGQVNPVAWGEWEKIDIPTSDEIVAIRPVVMAGRLYVVWAEYGAPILDANKKPTDDRNIIVKLSYKKYNDEWNAPHLLFSASKELIQGKNKEIKLLRLISLVDIKDCEPRLITMLFKSDVECDLHIYDVSLSEIKESKKEENYKYNLHLLFNDPKILQYQYSEYALDGAPSCVGQGGILEKNTALISLNVELELTPDGLGQQLVLIGESKINEANQSHALYLWAQDNNNNWITLFKANSLVNGPISTGKVIYPIQGPTNSYTFAVGYLVTANLGWNQYTVKLKDLHPSKLVESDPRHFIRINENEKGAQYLDFPPLYIVKYSLNTFHSGPQENKDLINLNFKIEPMSDGSSWQFVLEGTSSIKDKNGNKVFSIWDWKTPDGWELVNNENLPVDGKESIQGYRKIDDKNNIYYFAVGYKNDDNLGWKEFTIEIKRAVNSQAKPIRLNTLFGKQLVSRANVSIDSVLSLETQRLPEPPMGSGSNGVMDFYGANGLYFWELFFHLPFLVAHRLNAEQDYQAAQHWLSHIFNPAKKQNGKPDYWQVRPLLETGHVSYLLEGPTDPDAVAYADPVHYQKAVFLAYVRNLQDHGDQLYRQLTPDSLNEAKLRYYQALNLLGPRPDVHLAGQWTPLTLEKAIAKDDGNNALRTFEQTLTPETLAKMVLSPTTANPTLRALDAPRFRLPLNTQLLSYWDSLESRMYNLRHNLTLDGKPLSLPLYASPMNPLELLTQRASGGTLSSESTSSIVSIPPYRFRALLPRAQAAVEMLSGFGNTLLSALERQDRAAEEELQQSQLLELSSYVLTLQQQAIDSAQAGKTALQTSKAASQQRRDHYKALYDQNISNAERGAMALRADAQIAALATQPLQIASGVAALAPNIFGMADGGSKWDGPLTALAAVGQAASTALTISADLLTEVEQYRRRREEWEIQYQQAQSEINTIDKQIATQDLQIQAAQTTLQQTKAQQAKTQAMFTFLKTRFTQASLYQWIIGQVSALYYQAYDAVLSLCRGAEACWQYERGDFTTRFIQSTAWNDSYRGLLVGETLKLNLQQMEAAYLSRDERCLEITKTISLQQLIGGEGKWKEAVALLCGSDGTSKPFNDVLVSNGSVSFKLTERMFDQDYPGHYLRQLVNVSISLPAVVGPYQNVRAILTQTSNKLVLKPDSKLVTRLIKKNDETHDDDNLKTNQRASQQIALSTGIDDSGLFVLNFGDERYLPFEGTGAVSSWTLTFPRPADQQTMLKSLTDVIICVRYTAKDGGETFRQAVEDEVKSEESSGQQKGSSDTNSNVGKKSESTNEVEQDKTMQQAQDGGPLPIEQREPLTPPRFHG